MHNTKGIFTSEEYKELEECFGIVDTNYTGRLDQNELEEFFKELGLPTLFAKIAIFIFGSDNDKVIDFRGIIDFLTIFENMENEPFILFRKLFDAIDKNRNEKLSKNEIKVFCDVLDMKTSVGDLESVTKTFGKDKDESLSFEELISGLKLDQ